MGGGGAVGEDEMVNSCLADVPKRRGGSNFAIFLFNDSLMCCGTFIHPL